MEKKAELKVLQGVKFMIQLADRQYKRTQQRGWVLLKLVSGAKEGWGWDECGQSDLRERVCLVGVYPAALTGASAVIAVIKGAVVVWLREHRSKGNIGYAHGIY